MGKKTTRVRGNFTPEFKRDAVRLLRTKHPISCADVVACTEHPAGDRDAGCGGDLCDEAGGSGKGSRLAAYCVGRVGAGQHCCWAVNADPLSGESWWQRLG
jgi:hypothetical protein